MLEALVGVRRALEEQPHPGEAQSTSSSPFPPERGSQTVWDGPWPALPFCLDLCQPPQKLQQGPPMVEAF